MNKDIKYIQYRLKWLRETAKELKETYKKTKVSPIDELGLEVVCYTKQIEFRMDKIARRLK